MKRKTKNTLLSMLCCGLLATATVGGAAIVNADAESTRVKPTGLNTATLTQEINDADLDTFQIYGASTGKKELLGFRFLATIEQEDLALIPNTAEFGTVLIPNIMLGDAELTKDTPNALVAKALVDTAADEVPANGLGYYITLMGETLEAAFPENLYDTVLAARAYVKYTYTVDGVEITDYAYSANTLNRSIAYVASCELQKMENSGDPDTDTSSHLNTIISQTVATDATLSLSTEEFVLGDSATTSLSGATDGVNNYVYNLKSSNEDVAVIEDGKIVAVGVGTSIITATIGAKEVSMEITVVGERMPVEFTSGNIMYSTVNKEIFMPDGLLDEGETIVSAVGTTDGVDYFDKGTWSALAQTSDEIKTNAVRTTALTVLTSDNDLYTVKALSYAGVIDELSDFPAFFNNTAVASEYDAATYPAVAPNVYGYYIVTKSLGTGTEELTFTQTAATDYQKTNGFNGVLDGAGHKLNFKLNKGGLVGLVLGNATIKNLAVVYEDIGIVTRYDESKGYDVWVSDGYGVFGYITNGAPVIENCYIEKTNNHYMGSTLFGIMARPNGRLVLKNTAVHANNTSNKASLWSKMNISASSTNAYLIYARSNATSWTENVSNFTGVSTGNTFDDLSAFDTSYWSTSSGLNWKGLADTAVSVYDAKYVETVEEELMYSTQDSTMVLPEGLFNGETISKVSDENGTKYYADGAWTGLALTADEIKANATKSVTLTIETAEGYYYQVTVTSYAGVIDEFSDFTAFFNNEAVASEYDAATYPAVAPNVYGYYIVAKDLGSYTGSGDTRVFADELAFTQTSATDYQKTNGFNGVLDGQGYTLKFKLTSGGLVGLVLGNATIKNLAVIYEDASFISQAEGGGYGVFGYITNGSPVIDNCYIERTNNVASRSSVLGIMARPNAKLILKNTVVNAYRVTNDATWWSTTTNCISSASTNAYAIHGRANAASQTMTANFTKVYTDAIENGSLDVPLADIADASGFNDSYWNKVNGKLIWKGFETVTVSWVNGDTTTLEEVTQGGAIAIPTLPSNMYWSVTEDGTEVLKSPVKVNADVTYYAFSLDRTVEENAMYSTVNREFFLPDTMSLDMSEIVSITSEDDSVVYYENGAWSRDFSLSAEQIKANETAETAIKVYDGTINYFVTVTSYAGVIDELSDFPAFFNNTAVASEYDAATYPAVAPNVYGYYIVTKSLGTGTEELTFTQTAATDYQAYNGFNGVLDGAGHKLNFKLNKGGLVGLVLGNATIKNLAVVYEDIGIVTRYDESKGYDVWVSDGYGVFGYITNGAPVIENCYIEKTNNHYMGSTLFGIMARPNGRLVLKNTAVHANNTSNKASLWSKMNISASSTNAYLIYARSNATSWTENVSNFTGVSTSNTFDDLSAFDTSYWSTSSGLNWKGLADTAVSSVATVEIAPKDLVVDGATEYAIVLPTNADATLTTAKDELVSLFAEATGATLTVAADGDYDTYGTYISIGNTTTFSNSGIVLDGVSSQGYHIQKMDNTIYINGNSSLGCLYGVYGFLETLFGFEQYSEDTYALNKLSTVESDGYLQAAITESPDIEMRMPSNGALIGNATYADRMGMAMTENELFFQVGDYVNNANESANTGWRVWHNALEILPYSYWTGQGKTNWFSDNTVNGSVNQLCYTAHGNTDDYNAMVAQIVNVMAITLTSSQITSRPDAIYLTLTSEDGNGVCTCDACTAAKTQYGSNAGAVINLCNDVRKGVDEWMTANPTYKRDNVKVMFFAYNDYVDAPKADSIEMDKDVAVMYAISDYVNYYYDIDSTENAEFKAQFDAWAALTAKSGSDFCIWTYTKNFKMYMLRADVYGESAFFNERAYSYFAEKGVDLWFNQGATNGTATLSAFEKLNGYIDSQMMWDSTQTVAALTSEWFNAMYGAGASYMTSLYTEQNAKAREVFGTTTTGIPSVGIGSLYMKYAAKKILTEDVLNAWFGYITSAKSAVNADTNLTDDEKAKMIEHINEEWISVNFLYVYLHGKTTTSKAEFREVLGYDSSTDTYAKDVVILEGGESTLVEWIESDFTASI